MGIITSSNTYIIFISIASVIIFLHNFCQAAISVKISNLLICFSCFDLSCFVLKKDNFIKNLYIILSNWIAFFYNLVCFVSVHVFPMFASTCSSWFRILHRNHNICQPCHLAVGLGDYPSSGNDWCTQRVRHPLPEHLPLVPVLRRWVTVKFTSYVTCCYDI